MDVQLQELIEKIKKDGISTAKQESEALREKSKAEAAQIISDAKKQAEKIIKDAKKEAETFTASSNDTLSQAARDLLIQVQTSITGMYSTVLESAVSAEQGKILKDLIMKAAESWTKDELEIQLSETDFKALSGSLAKEVSDLLKKETMVTPNPRIKAGFRLAEKDGNAYISFESGQLAEMLGAYVNPRIKEILSKAAEGKGE
jgi:V/A-type H+-transporting ATPase subunit E